MTISPKRPAQTIRMSGALTWPSTAASAIFVAGAKPVFGDGGEFIATLYVYPASAVKLETTAGSFLTRRN